MQISVTATFRKNDRTRDAFASPRQGIIAIPYVGLDHLSRLWRVLHNTARLLGAKDNNQRDRALAATARIHGLVLVTRNVADVMGCDVDVLDPFVADPKIDRV